MSQLWSEINKVVNVLDLKSQSATTGLAIPCDVVNLENYKKLTYLITLGSVAAANKPTVTVLTGETAAATGVTTAIAFKYRTQVAGTGGSAGGAGSDAPSILYDSTGDGFAFTTGANGGVYIIEVDPSTVAAADTTDQTYDHVKLVFTNSTAGAAAAQVYGTTAVLSEPRYPQAILQTAID